MKLRNLDEEINRLSNVYGCNCEFRKILNVIHLDDEYYKTDITNCFYAILMNIAYPDWDDVDFLDKGEAAKVDSCIRPIINNVEAEINDIVEFHNVVVAARILDLPQYKELEGGLVSRVECTLQMMRNYLEHDLEERAKEVIRDLGTKFDIWSAPNLTI